MPRSDAQHNKTDQTSQRSSSARGKQGFLQTRQTLQAVGLRWWEWLWLCCIYGSVILGMCFLLATARPYYLSDNHYFGPTLIYSSDGVVLARLYEEYRVPVSIHQVPGYTVHAILAAEDVRFFHHRGLDARGIARALWFDIRTHHLRQGGSTITQQLVRYELLDDERSIRRKVREAVLAVRIERTYTKQDILQRYLNAVYFGGGSYGIGAAAQSYFHKSVEQLTPAESAMLASLIRAPGDGNPRINLPLTLRRQRQVLAMMFQQKWLSQEAYQHALHEKISIYPRQATAWVSPYPVEFTRQFLVQHYGKARVYRGGMRVYTTIDQRMQRMAERALLHAVEAGHTQHVGNGALISLKPDTGEIKAMVGGIDFWTSSFNRASQARRQPGSAFKVFVYQAALDAGYSLNDYILDAPVSVNGWSPKNYAERYHGYVSLQDALASSLNSVAVRLVAKLGPKAVVAAAHQAGITSELRADMTIALGTSEVTPLEMAHAFATYANDGVAVDPIIIRKITFKNQLLYSPTQVPQQRVDPATAFLITQGLQSVINYGTGRHAKIGRPAAGKTGTSSQYRDAWFVGYTPQLCTAVWLGNDNHRPMAGVSGGSLPAQAWAEYMHSALARTPISDFTVPYGVTQVRICTVSHMLALPTCPSTRDVYVSLKHYPTQVCDLHMWVSRKVCRESGKLANSTCTNVETRLFRYDEIPTEKCPINHTASGNSLQPKTIQPPVSVPPSDSSYPSTTQPAPDSPSIEPTPAIPPSDGDDLPPETVSPPGGPSYETPQPESTAPSVWEIILRWLKQLTTWHLPSL
ncbi:MAG TPA: PBP1A family penicillin-binding protein [Armatimonadota bacterium]|nr:PBP1A family penicillin-binding protein [Armatimonadota bacterium]